MIKDVKGMLYMNSVLEKQESKLFQPLPLRNNIIPKHIILDTACIIKIVPQEEKGQTFQMDKKCIKTREILAAAKE